MTESVEELTEEYRESDWGGFTMWPQPPTFEPILTITKNGEFIPAKGLTLEEAMKKSLLMMALGRHWNR